MTDPQVSYLFIGGNPRSGTSALTSLINAHPEAAIGMERYIRVWRDETLGPDDFTAARFLARHSFDEGRDVGQHFTREGFEERYDGTRLRGDKLPYISDHLSYVSKTFDPCQVLFILRNPLSVCESFQARFDNPEDVNFNIDGAQALVRWNRALRQLQAGLEAGVNVTVVCYERAFRSQDAARRILEAVGCDPDAANWERIDQLLAKAADISIAETTRNEDMRWNVARQADFDLYRRMVDEVCILRDL